MSKPAKSRTYLADGIVLRVGPLGEKDRLVTIFTEEHGKIRAVARGARNPKSRLTAATQPFVMAHFALVRGRSLDILTQAQIETLHRGITVDVLKIAWASYLCELCDLLPDEMPAPEMYALLLTALERLAAAESTFDAEVVGRWFETCYLSSQGYAPTIGYCMSCEQKITLPRDERERRIAYSVQLGGTICDTCAPRISGTRKVPAQALRILHRLAQCEMPPIPERAANVWHIDQSTLIHLRDILRLSMEQHPEIRTKSRVFLTEMLADMK